MQVIKQVEREINSYINESVEISEGFRFSQYKIVKRIMIYLNGIYPSGKQDEQGDYKYWYDIISPRIEDEVKNIDFDTKDISLYSDFKKDNIPVYLGNARMKEWLRESGQAEKLNNSIRQYSSWGNVVWKKVKDGYEKVDLRNFFVVNQTAETLEDTAVIERHIFTQSNLREKSEVWNNVEMVIKSCGNKSFKVSEKANLEDKETLYYEIYERNGEISEKDLNEAMEKSGGKEDKYLLAKVIFAGLGKGKEDGKYILYAEEIKKMPYKEAHRGDYNGRWWRLGIVELLFDIATRANDIGNQLAKGLQWSSRTIFRSSDKVIAQNILTDLANGDIIRSQDLSQVQTRMEGFDQLIAEWNRIIEFADRLCHSFEIVRGESLPSGTPFRLGALLNVNVNKFFNTIRENLEIVFQDLIEDWILPDILKDLKAQDVLRLTGDSDYLDIWYKKKVDIWYTKNLLALPPLTEEQKRALFEKKLMELREQGDTEVPTDKSFWKEFKPRIKVVIAGENVNLESDLQDLATFIGLEVDPVRRTALIELAMSKKNFDVASLPKSEQLPEQPAQQPRQPELVEQPV